MAYYNFLPLEYNFKIEIQRIISYNIVKNIHKRVENVKNDISLEVKFMTLLERDREKIEEGREEGIQEGITKGKTEGKAEILTKLLVKKFNIKVPDYNDKINKLSDESIDKIITDIFDINKIEELEKYFTPKV